MSSSSTMHRIAAPAAIVAGLLALGFGAYQYFALETAENLVKNAGQKVSAGAEAIVPNDPGDRALPKDYAELMQAPFQFQQPAATLAPSEPRILKWGFYYPRALSVRVRASTKEVPTLTPPASLTAERKADAIALTWGHAGGNDIVTGYLIERKKTKESDYQPLTEIGDPAVLQFTDETILLDQEYSYRLACKGEKIALSDWVSSDRAPVGKQDILFKFKSFYSLEGKVLATIEVTSPEGTVNSTKPLEAGSKIEVVDVKNNRIWDTGYTLDKIVESEEETRIEMENVLDKDANGQIRFDDFGKAIYKQVPREVKKKVSYIIISTKKRADPEKYYVEK